MSKKTWQKKKRVRLPIKPFPLQFFRCSKEYGVLIELFLLGDTKDYFPFGPSGRLLATPDHSSACEGHSLHRAMRLGMQRVNLIGQRKAVPWKEIMFYVYHWICDKPFTHASHHLTDIHVRICPDIFPTSCSASYHPPYPSHNILWLKIFFKKSSHLCFC